MTLCSNSVVARAFSRSRPACGPGFLLMCFVFVFCLASVPAYAAVNNRVREVSFAADASSETVTLALSNPVSFKVNVLDRNQAAGMPWRLYVDLENTIFAPGLNRNIRPQGACVRAVRSALNDPRTARVVLELNHPLVEGDYTVVQHDSPPALDIIVHAEKIRARLNISAEPVVRVPPPEPPAAQTPAAAAAEPPVTASEGEKRITSSGSRTYLIAIDAGHGGRDPGAIGHGGLKEKDICLALARELKSVLDRRPGYTTLMTRTDDRFVPLEDRARIASEAEADLLISIHGNSHVDAKVDGIETYYLNFSSDKLTAAITGRYKTLRNLGVKHAPMRVLIDAEMPGILFEAGFISNPAEAKRLQNPAHQKLLAEAIAAGIHDFFSSSKTALYLNR